MKLNMQNNRVLIYTLIAVSALVMATGGVSAAFADVRSTAAPTILLSALCPASTMIVVAWLADRVLVPRFFMRQKYALFMIVAFLLAMLVPVSGIAVEGLIRHLCDLPDRIENYASPWILVDSLSTASLLMVIMIGMGVGRAYRQWQDQVKIETMAARECRAAIESLKTRIRHEDILNTIRSIRQLVGIDCDKANEKLMNLSDCLRHELYDRTACQSVNVTQSAPCNQRLADFIASRRYTLLRDLCLKALIACVALTAIFEAPDRPNLTMDGLWSFLGMFAVVSLLAYGNKSLSKHFLNKGKLRKYIVAAGVFMVAMTVMAIVAQTISYVNGGSDGGELLIYNVITIVSSFLTITLFFCGDYCDHCDPQLVDHGEPCRGVESPISQG